MSEATRDITVRKAGSFFFVQADGETLGHIHKVVGFQGESAWTSFLRMIFRPLWRASARIVDPHTGKGGFVHLEEVHGKVFRNRDEAVAAILQYHGVDGRPRYLRPWSRRELEAILEKEPPAQG